MLTDEGKGNTDAGLGWSLHSTTTGSCFLAIILCCNAGGKSVEIAAVKGLAVTGAAITLGGELPEQQGVNKPMAEIEIKEKLFTMANISDNSISLIFN